MASFLQTLNLVGDNDERRVFPRMECADRVEGLRLDHSIPARQNPKLMLALRDVSMGGLSGASETPLQIGERVAVYFPKKGLHPGWDACGRVIRCKPSALGYQVAMQFEPIPLAA